MASDRAAALYQGDGVPLLARMTIPPLGDVGMSIAPPGGAAPFAVTAPPALNLAADRTGSTSFTITNLTGRPVRARLVPRGQAGAQDAWLSVDGLAEIPMAVGATITATVQVKVPLDAPAGQHTLFLEVVAEDDTESVAGQSVSFSVPAPDPVNKFPWWIVIVGAVVLALLVGGAVFFFTRDKGTGAPPPATTPVNTDPPRVAGGVKIGLPLTAQDGSWSGKDVTVARQWQRCEATGDPCADISGATQATYTVTPDDTGKTIRIVVAASNAAGTTRADSAAVGPVDVEQVKVPSFFGMSVVQAEKTAAGVGLKVQTQVLGARCPPVAIEGQDPLPGKALSRGGTVIVVIPFPLPNISCGGI